MASHVAKFPLTHSRPFPVFKKRSLLIASARERALPNKQAATDHAAAWYENSGDYLDRCAPRFAGARLRFAQVCFARWLTDDRIRKESIAHTLKPTIRRGELTADRSIRRGESYSGTWDSESASKSATASC